MEMSHSLERRESGRPLSARGAGGRSHPFFTFHMASSRNSCEFLWPDLRAPTKAGGRSSVQLRGGNPRITYLAPMIKALPREQPRNEKAESELAHPCGKSHPILARHLLHRDRPGFTSRLAISTGIHAPHSVGAKETLCTDRSAAARWSSQNPMTCSGVSRVPTAVAIDSIGSCMSSDKGDCYLMANRIWPMKSRQASMGVANPFRCFPSRQRSAGM